MKTKVLLTSFITLCLTYAGCVALTIKMANINECGYANNFNEIPGIKEEKLFSPNIHTEGNLFFQRTGYLSHFALYIIGKFSTETFEKLINDPRSLALPLPCFSYEDHSPINGYLWSFENIPNPIVNKLKLCKRRYNYYSELNGYTTVFTTYCKKYSIEIVLLDKTRFFVITITHSTR